MRVDAHPERTRHVCDFLALGEAAGGANIGLQEIDRPVDEDRSKAPAGKLGLAPGDRDTKGRLHLTIPLQILRRHWFLEPRDVEFLDLPSHSDHCRRIVGVIGNAVRYLSRTGPFRSEL